MPQFLVVVKGTIKSHKKQMHVSQENRDTRPERETALSHQVLFPPLRVQVSSSDAELLAIRPTMEGKNKCGGCQRGYDPSVIASPFLIRRKEKYIFPDVGKNSNLQLQVQLYCCFCKGWKPNSDTVSGSKHQDRESENPEKKVILFWVILAITLTALRCFQGPCNTKGSDIVTTVPTSWKLKVIIRKLWGGLEEIFFSLFWYFPSMATSHKRVLLIPGVLSTYLWDEIKTLCELY